MIKPPTMVGKVLASLTDNSIVTGMSTFSLPVHSLDMTPALIYICVYAAKLPECTTSRIPWRKADADYMNNEVYFDFHERVDAILDANEQVISAEVFGKVQTTCHLSGAPDMLLSFSRSSILDDVHLHRCVRINRFERERVVSFVPPDGAFTLMSYRVDGFKQMPISVRPSVTVIGTTGKLHIAVAPLHNERKPVEDLSLTIPLPKCTLSSAMTASGGAIRYDETSKVLKWDIGFLPENKKQVLEGTFELPAAYVHEDITVVNADFNIKMFALSGLKVDGLTISNVKYKPFKGFRTVTTAGNFQIRCT
jgi:AP-3 complex subunit mu